MQQLLAVCVSPHIGKGLLVNILFYLFLRLIALAGMDHSYSCFYGMHQISLVFSAGESNFVTQTL